MSFEHLRHKPPTTLERPRELILVCAPLRSNVNLSNMLRTAGCCGISRLIACGNPSIHKSIARDGAEQVELEVHRTLLLRTCITFRSRAKPLLSSATSAWA